MPDQPRDEHDRSNRAGDPAVVLEVFEQLPLLVAATEGPDHRVVAATGAHRDRTGRQEIIGTSLREAFAGCQAAFDEVYSTGRPLRLRDFRARLTAGGSPVEFFAGLDLWPRTGPGGEPVGVTVVMTDVTERVQER